MNEKYEDFLYVFHSTKAQRSNLEKIIKKAKLIIQKLFLMIKLKIIY